MALDDKDFRKKLQAALSNLKKGSVKGVRLATAHIKLQAQQRVPVDEGNLKASAYTNVNLQKNNVVGEIGFTANYAAAVHEMPMVNEGTARHNRYIDGVFFEGKGDYWDPQGTATNKFLEIAIDENQSEILTILQKCAEI